MPRVGDGRSVTRSVLQQRLVDGLELCRRVLAQAPQSGFVESEFVPGPAAQTDAKLLAFARQTGGTVFHPTSTCMMGFDPLSVVGRRRDGVPAQ